MIAIIVLLVPNALERTQSWKSLGKKYLNSDIKSSPV